MNNMRILSTQKLLGFVKTSHWETRMRYNAREDQLELMRNDPDYRNIEIMSTRITRRMETLYHLHFEYRAEIYCINIFNVKELQEILQKNCELYLWANGDEFWLDVCECEDY